MRVMFLNSLEKKDNVGVAVAAQVWIGEEDGSWRIGWNEIMEGGTGVYLVRRCVLVRDATCVSPSSCYEDE